MEPKSIKDCTVTELKAFAYDRVLIIEKAQKELQIINQELAGRNQPELCNQENLGDRYEKC